ncbi:MAG: hypothetical protein KJ697_04510 [Nanoarchaeota archaeon]|nr:hypothetical protein [Nanoarchaeota archaeon]
MSFERKREDVDNLLKELLEATWFEKPEPRKTRLDISFKCDQKNCGTDNCKADKIIKENSYCFGNLKDERTISDVRVCITEKGKEGNERIRRIVSDVHTYAFNTSLIPSEGWEYQDTRTLHIEEGETRISTYRDGDMCRVMVYTQAVPGNGGLQCMNLRSLEKMKYT